jgi:hypothetical protein
MEIPVLTQTRENCELLIHFVLDMKTGDWLATRIEIRPGDDAMIKMLPRLSPEQQLAQMRRYRASRHEVDLTTLSPTTPLLAE